ncbi:E3 ubiquitin-protein ligase rnf213-alpha-like [Glandiceps talaboti]
MLPGIVCRSPRETMTLEIMKEREELPAQCQHDPLLDYQEFISTEFQRVTQYLLCFSGGVNLDTFTFQHNRRVDGAPQCLDVLLRHCGVQDPSWAELRHFVCFLNQQLQACENSVFCKQRHLEDASLNGFLNFVVRFMMQMSKDFATPSLQLSDESSSHPVKRDTGENDLAPFQLRRTWENSPHPYIFFNHDHVSMTFLGFHIDDNGSLIDHVTHTVIEQNLMTTELRTGLELQKVNLSASFDDMDRVAKLEQLCRVMGIDWIHDPDSTYELTTDNVKKILAILMRFRCGIPVIIMGETGCGKTRLIKFMCDLQAGPVAVDGPKNMILMKVHGGTTALDIIKKVGEAEKLAVINRTQHKVDTVLFFDEANTTEAIGLIKEIMCDRRMNGKPLSNGDNSLKIVAACNPYRRHTLEMIDKLESAGLGYHIRAEETDDKLGRIPLRQLVYRVQALPPSMLPLVWDFGQLSSEVEELYIKQIVARYVHLGEIPRGRDEVISSVLAASQRFMRETESECSFVSLRDVERAMNVLVWFYNHEMIANLMGDKARRDNGEDTDMAVDLFTLALILSLGVCYHACLQDKREEYREYIEDYFVDPCQVPGGAAQIVDEITRCQDVFLDQLELGPNIARNAALKENVFMMVVCIELRIPLFLVGKPGSSKSLAKTIVADAMQGEAAPSELFRTFKQVHMVSYQCSPLSTPEGIVGTFRQCSRFQEGKDLNRFVSVVVLDEVGLAEDSPKLPLKTLHPLLEYGCDDDDNPPAHKKVAFIGISNWALDPAKMNRGILVSRGVPDEDELVESAKGICSTDQLVFARIDPLIPTLSRGYLRLYETQEKEFFGLRDFYSLIKMVYGFSKASKEPPTWAQLVHAIRRNFGGMDNVNPVRVFKQLMDSVDQLKQRGQNDPECHPSALIQASLHGLPQAVLDMDSESRYLLVLTENYAALGILRTQLLNSDDPVIIFGSSFPKDQEYTQVCRNINRIKVCMETGRTVVLLNLENLYESLYDALNQYYVYFGGQRYVDLGLGTHRVKCRVHNEFRLIVVADKEVVYERFPIPLINRLEKHFLAMTTMLTHDELTVVERLKEWTHSFATIKLHQHEITRSTSEFKVEDVFIGFNNDTIASIVLQVCSDMNQHEANDDQDWAGYVFETAQDMLLQCVTPDSVARLSRSGLGSQAERILQKYFKEQKHGSVAEYIEYQINIAKQNGKMTGILAQVTTHARLLSRYDIQDLACYLELQKRLMQRNNVFLQEFQTEQQFTRKVREFFRDPDMAAEERLLLVQCDSGDENTNLIACSRYIVQDERAQAIKQNKGLWQPAHVVFIIQLPRIAGGCFDGLQGGKWLSVHLDELRPSQANLPEITALHGQPISAIFESDVTEIRTDKKSRRKMSQGKVPIDDSGMELSVDTDQTVDTVTDPPSSMDVENGSDMEVDTSDPVSGNVVELMQTENDELAEDNVEEVTDAVTVKRTVLIDAKCLLRSCIHAATKMLEDVETRTNRSTKRIDILLDLFTHQDEPANSLSFSNVVKGRICQLLKEKDDRSGPHRAGQWLCREALTGQRIQINGTFRRAIWQSLVKTVTPLLAEIIAFCDRDDNLDLIYQSPSDCWLHKLWLEILLNPRLTELKYESLLSPVRETARETIPVISSSVNKMYFTCQCPFSWLIKGLVDDIWQTAPSMKVSANQRVQTSLESLLQMSELGTTIVTDTKDENYNNFIRCYLHDYIRMVFKATNEQHIQFIVRAIEIAAVENHLKEGGEVADFVLTVPDIHVYNNYVHARLENFCQIMHLLPNGIDIPVEQDLQLVADAFALRALLESLEPQRDHLNSIEKRHEWLKRVHDAKPVIERILESENQNRELYGEISRTHILHCRPLWTRLCVLKLFVQYVCPPNTKVGEENIKQCYRLKMALGEEVDLKSERSMTTIENFLRKCNEAASRQHFKYGIHECDICKEAITEPVALPCEHVFCLKCLSELFRLSQNKVCPVCRIDVGSTFKLECTTQSKKAVAEHNAFRQRCNAFFMELVSRYCFAEGAPPEPELVNKLLGYVTRQTEEKGLQTKRFTPFQEDCIDPNPVVRSFLLQLLLRTSGGQVYEHLQSYFDKAQTFFQSREEIIELCLLCIQCIEDSFHNRITQSESDTQQAILEVAVERFRRTLDTGTSGPQKGPSVQQLESIAGARFGLVIAAELIYRYYGNNEQQNKALQERQPENFRHTRKLLDIAWRFCEKSNSKWPKVFLVKQLCRRYGSDCLQTLVKHHHLRWIMPPEGKVQVEVIPDRFIVSGNAYKELREAMAQALLDGHPKRVSVVLQNMKECQEVKEAMVLLAVYREVTMAYANKMAATRQAPIDPQVIQNLIDFVEHSQYINKSAFGRSMILNKQGGKCNQLEVSGNDLPINRTVSAMVIHVLIVLQCGKANKVIQPLVTLMENPQQMSKSYFPTMREDMIMEAREAVRDKVRWYGSHQNFKQVLESKKCRQNWEDAFTKSYVNPVIEGIAPKLQQANAMIHNDERLGTNPLMKLLYEVDPVTESMALDSLENIPSVWRYRSRVTVEHMSHFLLDSAKIGSKKCSVLHAFLQKEHKLRAIKYLPDIVHLQQLLIDQYHRNIDIQEATKLKIGQFLNGLPKGHIQDKYRSLVKSFSTAWNLVRSDVATYGGLFVPQYLCERDIDENSSLSMILPTRKSDGVCSTALLDFLIVTQNEFIQTYNSIKNQAVSEEVIKPSDLTPADLISYDPEKDLLPIVLSNCNYSLEIGHGTLVEYDLEALEKQLEDRFIKGKALIQGKIEQLVFRQDSRDAATFETLKTKIPQEALSKAIQHQILSELRSLTDVCDSLACLDIAIGFLATSGGKPDMLVTKYLTTVLKMDKDEMKVKHQCKLKHVLSLWQLLAVEKAKKLTLNQQDPFDFLTEYRDKLNPEQQQSLQSGLRHINLDSLVDELHQFIVIGLRKYKDGEQDVANWGLKDTLCADEGDQITGFSEYFPQSVKISNIWWTWTEVVKYHHSQAVRY